MKRLVLATTADVFPQAMLQRAVNECLKGKKVTLMCTPEQALDCRRRLPPLKPGSPLKIKVIRTEEEEAA